MKGLKLFKEFRTIRSSNGTLNPTGGGLRSDTDGMGFFKAKRGNRKHIGIDIVCVPGQEVYMPVIGTIKRISKPYASTDYSGVYIESCYMDLKLWYFEPAADLIGTKVCIGTPIGLAQDIRLHYPECKNMLPHLHLKIVNIDPELVFNIPHY